VTIVCDDVGQAGLVMEHSWGDGSVMQLPVSLMHHWGTAFEQCTDADDSTTVAHVVPTADLYYWISFDLVEPVRGAIRQANTEHRGNINAVAIAFCSLPDAGAMAIKTTCRTSPDAFMHTAFHLSQQEVFGDVRSTYASLLMKKYHHGRTETFRTVLDDTHKVIQAVGKAQLGRSSVHAQTAMAALTKAHSARIERCRQGFGFHRHAMCLRFALATLATSHHHQPRHPSAPTSVLEGRAEIAALLSHESFRELGTDYLSTSSINYLGVDFFAFGPVTKNGLGIGYSIFDTSINLVITSFTSIERRVILATTSGGATLVLMPQ